MSPGAEAFSRSQAIAVLKRELTNYGTEMESMRSGGRLIQFEREAVVGAGTASGCGDDVRKRSESFS